MSKHEIALQLTLAAIESGKIKPAYDVPTSADEVSSNNNFFANEITNFYNHIFDNIHCKP